MQRNRSFGESTTATPESAPVTPSDLERVVAELTRLNYEGKLSGFTLSLHEQYGRKGTLSEKQVAAMIKGMDKPKVERSPLPDVPAGRYAITGQDGSTDFYKVDRPEEGKWAGYTFVKLLVASGGFGDDLSEQRVAFNQTRSVLEHILEDGVETAMKRYGHALGVCGHCGRTLTDNESIERGIGPVCAGKMGF